MKNELLHPLISSSFTNLLGLIRSYGCEFRFFPRLLYLAVMTLLRQPTIWLEKAIYGHRIERQTIAPAPLFIIGHWRSGTTHLQNLMSRDTQFGGVTLLQAGMPLDMLVLSRVAKGDLGGVLPKTRLMDNVPIAANVPWEEELALTSVGRLSFYHVSFFPRCMGRIFDEAVLLNDGRTDVVDKWKRQYLHFLRKIQFVQQGKRLLLKNPANTARVSLLRQMFPGAQFIHLHRDPYKVFASSVHLYLKAQEAWGLHRTSRDLVVQHVLDSYPKLMNAFFLQRKGMKENELVDVSFRSLQDDPMETLATIYRRLGLSGFEAAAPAFESYLASQRNYRKNHLPLAPAEKEDVAHRWRDVFDELGYPL